MICQKLEGNQRGGRMRTWFAESGLSAPVEEDGWFFTESDGAYAAARIVTGGSHWEDSQGRAKGQWLYCDDEYSPVILEVDQKSRYGSAEDFRKKLIGSKLSFKDNVLDYTSVYGDRFSFFADFSQSPSINGVPVDYAPPKVFDSPFLQSDWNSGIATIQKGSRTMTLNFNSN